MLQTPIIVQNGFYLDGLNISISPDVQPIIEHEFFVMATEGGIRRIP